MTIQILVFRGKHNDDYYRADTLEEIDWACRQVLLERWDAGWFYDPREDESYDEASANLTDEQIAALPTPELQVAAKKSRSRARAEKQRIEADASLYEDIERVVSNAQVSSIYDETYMKIVRDVDNRPIREREGGPYLKQEAVRRVSRAYQICESRDGGEYEGMELIKVWGPEDDGT